jgi:hypothetical protein
VWFNEMRTKCTLPAIQLWDKNSRVCSNLQLPPRTSAAFSPSPSRGGIKLDGTSKLFIDFPSYSLNRWGNMGDTSCRDGTEINTSTATFALSGATDVRIHYYYYYYYYYSAADVSGEHFQMYTCIPCTSTFTALRKETDTIRRMNYMSITALKQVNVTR